MTDITLAPDSIVGDVAARLPGAAEVFRRAGISFCCGGNARLAEAAEKAGVALSALTAELQALIDNAGRDAPTETPALIDHILTRYHDTHRQELRGLIDLAERVEMVHGDHEEAPLGLTDALEALRDELESHMAKEETVLFPAILHGAGAMLAGPIRVMQAEHEDTAQLLRRIEHVTHGLTLPVGACGSWTALYTGLRKLCDDVVAHIHLEENVLFPRVLAA
ncbi:iron-sulfur cluster repair di-iron protein [Paracoccus sp. MKU1]|uniref:iron-sulfur cluster repair di-iron protein n=1 Tax=Paracoccus sp. MKU1 TaxID=1745182 RepID=UPI00071937F4|nr:iron-sulfur cluster repair di-iron protein [Paracoccus sp. MKU1]KRW96111.1 iron-sulfur cluster repair di-iron protein [Paracoccus sp. MKU1]